MFEIAFFDQSLQVMVGMRGYATFSDGEVELSTSETLGEGYSDDEKDLLHEGSDMKGLA